MTFVHTRTGGLYHIVNLVIIEATMQTGVVYANMDGICFMRPASEFFDGRFQHHFEKETRH